MQGKAAGERRTGKVNSRNQAVTSDSAPSIRSVLWFVEREAVKRQDKHASRRGLTVKDRIAGSPPVTASPTRGEAWKSSKARRTLEGGLPQELVSKKGCRKAKRRVSQPTALRSLAQQQDMGPASGASWFMRSSHPYKPDRSGKLRQQWATRSTRGSSSTSAIYCRSGFIVS